MKKKSLIILLLVVAVLLVGGGAIWYTRPQSFWDATGMDRDSITGASGYAMEVFVTEEETYQQTWTMDNLSPSQEDFQALLELLDATTYHTSLKNFLPPFSWHTSNHCVAEVSFALGDQLATVYAYHTGEVLIFSSQRERSAFFSASPRELNETLADFIQQRDVADNP